MIKKIVSVKNLGIFRDYKWDASLQDFCRYNLIYGWNGAGKTTLARLFAALSIGELEKYPHLQYEVATVSKTWKQGSNCNEKIRVFNRDYVRANVERVDGPRPIFILGAENTQLVGQIAQDEKALDAKSGDVNRFQTEHEGLIKRRGKLFTDVARTISQNASGESTRVYRRPNAEADFAKLKSKELQDSKRLETLRAALNQQQRPRLEVLPDFADLAPTLKAIQEDATKLLGKTVSSGMIDRLAEHSDIANWVETGVKLHHVHNSSTCEFCTQAIPKDRTQALAAHFNDADQALKHSVDELHAKVQAIRDRLINLVIREPSNLYDEMANEYQAIVDDVMAAQEALQVELDNLADQIIEKKSHTNKPLTPSSVPDAGAFVDAIERANAQIARHNAKTENFDKQEAEARHKLKCHYLSEIFDEVKELQSEIDKAAASIAIVTDGDPDDPDDCSMAHLKKRLADARAKVSSSHAACKEINEKLALFLGRDELSFEVSGDGYEIKRAGETASDLSESELTAVAFVYFVVHLSDRDFSLKDGIVIIDDPISSLDANSLFQAFAFLKQSVIDAKQVFILTHNFEFMRQVKSWFFHIKKISGQPQRSFYMINNRENNDKREAFLAPLDRLLKEFQSEYHYLFSLLQTFKDDGSLESIYNFPNIGRKFLETFLAFKVPSQENLHQKMAHIDYDESKKTAILRFVQTHSHAERSDGVLNFDMTLSRGGQTAIQDLLGMVQAVDKTHYDTLVSTINR